MKEPRVTLKNVKTFRGMEGIGLNADIYINGYKCLFMIDEGNGGEVNYESYVLQTKNEVMKDRINNLIKYLNDYIETLPRKTEKYGDKTYEIKVNRDIYIDDILNKMEEEKEKKKLQKLFNTGIVIGIPHSGKYQYIKFKRPLSEIAPMIVQKHINIAKLQYCKKGVQILNTNLIELGLTV